MIWLGWHAIERLPTKADCRECGTAEGVVTESFLAKIATEEKAAHSPGFLWPGRFSGDTILILGLPPFLFFSG